MTFDVDWGDIKAPSKAKAAKKAKSSTSFDVDWGGLSEKPPINALKEKHPLLYKLAEHLQGNPLLEKAGGIAEKFNRGVEQTGLPSMAKGFFGTGINMGRGIANLIPGVNIQEQEYPQLNIGPNQERIAEFIGSLGMGVPAFKGYQAAKQGINMIPWASHIPEIIKNLSAGGLAGSVLSPDNRILGGALGAGLEGAGSAIRGGKNFIANRNTGAKGREYLEAQLTLERQKAAEQSEKAIAKHNFGKNTPEALELSAKEKEQQFLENQKRQEKFGENAKMLPGEQTVPEVEHRLAENTNALQQHLGHGEPHSLLLSDRISNAIEGVPTIEPHPVTGYPRVVRKGGLREQIGSQYDKLAETFPEKIQLPGKVDVQGIQKEYDTFLKDFPNVADETKEEFRQIAAKTHPGLPGKEINPKAFFKAYRAMKQQEGNLRSKAHTFGTSLADAEILNKKADSLKHTYEDMQKVIEDHFPKDTIKELHRINHEYSTQIAPLNKNKVYSDMRNSGNISGNILEKLSGKEKGNNLVRDMIMNDPELSRLALGHSFAEKPQNLLKPNQIIEPYIKASPEISNLLGQQRQAQQNLLTAQQNELLVSQFENQPKLRAEFNRQRAMAKRLRDEAEVTGLSKAEVLRRKEAYEQAQRKLNSTIKKALGGIGTSVAGGYTLKKLLE